MNFQHVLLKSSTIIKNVPNFSTLIVFNLVDI